MLFDNQNYEKLYEEALIAKKMDIGYKFRPKLPISNLSHFQRMILLRLILNSGKIFNKFEKKVEIILKL